MSKVHGWLWKCDRAECGYIWHTQGSEPPKQCAKCKARNWNTKAPESEAAELIREVMTRPQLHVINPIPYDNTAVVDFPPEIVLRKDYERERANACNCGSLTGGHRSKCPMYKGKK